MPLWHRKHSNSWNDMSLLRLLTAGKSLVGLKGTENRYSVARRGLLPKFTSKKNPFHSGTRPEPGNLPGDTSPSCPNAAESKSVNGANCDPGMSAIQHPAVAVAPQIRPTTSWQQKAEETSKVSTPKWRALLPWLRPRAPKPAIPRFAKTMVQGELSLEAVKVVRNDLSDSDLEIVPTKLLPPRVDPKPARQVTAEPCAGESSWGRLTGRFLGAGKT